ncbi:MAG TPA: hypothetical protein VNF27_13460 [Candidatus Binataceae bacterium]|nr:hypothetical protein [Candidatus Binataceae bacterium]
MAAPGAIAAALTMPMRPSKLLLRSRSKEPPIMPSFAKNPKFIIGTIVILWVIYVIWANIQPQPVDIYLFPHFLKLQIQLSAIILGSAIFGVIVTIVIQYFWRRSSKNASSPAPAANRSTVA